MRRSCRSPDNQAMSNQLDPRPRHARPAFGGRGLFLGFTPPTAPPGPYGGLPDPVIHLREDSCGRSAPLR